MFFNGKLTVVPILCCKRIFTTWWKWMIIRNNYEDNQVFNLGLSFPHMIWTRLFEIEICMIMRLLLVHTIWGKQQCFIIVSGSQVCHFTWLPAGQVHQILYLPGQSITCPAKFLHLIKIVERKRGVDLF